MPTKLVKVYLKKNIAYAFKAAVVTGDSLILNNHTSTVEVTRTLKDCKNLMIIPTKNVAVIEITEPFKE